MATLTQDVRYAIRTLLSTPAFTIVVVLTLGLGIGANTAIFSLMDQMLLRLLPVKNPSELVQLDGPGPFSGRTQDDRTFSYPVYTDLRDRNEVFSGLVARFAGGATFTYRGQAERVSAELVSGNTFEVLGVGAVIGRTFTPDDDRTPGAHPVAMLSWSFWQRRFAGDPAALNQVVTINATPMTIVGVAPNGFSGVVSAQTTDVFVPMMMKAQMTPTWNDLDNRRSRWVSIVGRLKPGMTMAAAKPQLDVLYRQISEHELEAVPEFAAATQTFKDRFRVRQLDLYQAGRGLSDVRSMVTAPLYVLMSMVGLVLLIACANVANLLLTRATSRQKEIAIRLALGAGRKRLIQQTLTESVVLAGLGGAAGLVLSIWLSDLLMGVLPWDTVTRAISTEPDLRVAGFTALLSLVTAVVFGLAPALQGSKPELNRTLREEAGSLAGGVHHARIRKGLVVAQVALSMLLIAGAGLFARSLYNLKNLDTGFDTVHATSFSIDPSMRGYDQPRIRQFYQGLLARLRELPGVTAASLADDAVMTGSRSARTVRVQGYEMKPDEDMNPWTNEIAPDYFHTMGVPLVAGREFTDRDVIGAPLVAIVNEKFATYFFGDQNPLGQRFWFRALGEANAMEIVGIVKDSLYATMRQGTGSGDDNETPRFVFTPYQQSSEVAEATVYVRSANAAVAAALPAQIRQAVRQSDASVPVDSMQTLEQTVDEALFNERMLALLSALFGLLATVLAAVGLYGVMSYTVSRRTREIGIRIALGAERSAVIGMVLKEVALLTLVGIGLGVPGALGLSQLVKSQLFGISPADPVTIVVAAVSLGLVALFAGYIPARRAARVQPVLALRYE